MKALTKRTKNRILDVCDIVWIILLTGVCMSLALNDSVWLDEAYSMRWSAFPTIKDVIGVISPDVHPPLHYIMLHYVLKWTGGGLLWAKVFVVLGFTAMITAGYVLSKIVGNRSIHYFFSLFAISLPFMLTKAVEIRMYSWSMAFAAWVGIFVILVFRNNTIGSWIGLVLCALASAYNHYYGLITMAFLYVTIGVILLINRRWDMFRRFIIASIATAIGYIPWLPTALKQVSTVNGDYWIEAKSVKDYIKDLLRVDAFPHSTKVYLLLIAIACILIFWWGLAKKRDVQDNLSSFACIVPFAGVYAFGYLYGVYIRPIMIARYLMIPFILLLIGVSVTCRYLKKWMIAIPCVFFIAMTVLIYPTVHNAEYNTHTDETLALIDSEMQTEDVFAYNCGGGMGSVLLYYYPDASIDNALSINDIVENGWNADKGRVWYLDSFGEVADNYEALVDHNIAIENKGEYGIDNVNFAIYIISK